MISKTIQRLCSEDISLIENYDKAISDETQTWHCHHKFEIDMNLSFKQLIEKNLYWKRPASELIFLTPHKHKSLHHKGKHYSEETKYKISEAKKGKPAPWASNQKSEETKRKMSESHKGVTSPYKGKHRSEETKKKMSEARKGKHWYIGEDGKRHYTD